MKNWNQKCFLLVAYTESGNGNPTGLRPVGQGSAILSESVRNRDTKGPGIGIGIEFCTSLGLSIGLGIEFFYFWVPHSINLDISSYFTL